MRVIAVKTLRDFSALHLSAKAPLSAWYQEAKAAVWLNPTSIKEQYRSASILQGGRVIFNIAGNKYRLVVQVAYRTQIVFIKFIGTHDDYDRIDPQTIELGGRKK